MRIGGANTRFPYSANHSAYINAAASGKHPGIEPVTLPLMLQELGMFYVLAVAAAEQLHIRCSQRTTSSPLIVALLLQ